jgi:hypothetical protein
VTGVDPGPVAANDTGTPGPAGTGTAGAVVAVGFVAAGTVVAVAAVAASLLLAGELVVVPTRVIAPAGWAARGEAAALAGVWPESVSAATKLNSPAAANDPAVRVRVIRLARRRPRSRWAALDMCVALFGAGAEIPLRRRLGFGKIA